MDPELLTQPLQHFGNKEYYLHFFLIVFWCFSHFCGCVLYLNMDPEPSTQPLQYHSTATEDIFSDFLATFHLIAIFRYWPWILNTASPTQHGNTIFHLFFANFLVIFHHFIGVFLFKVKCSRSVERWINQSINQWKICLSPQLIKNESYL